MRLVKHLRALEIATGRPDPFPPPPPLLCTHVSCGKVGSPEKRCGKCFVACYCCIECQREDWPAHKAQCKLNRKFELKDQTEEVRVRKERSDG